MLNRSSKNLATEQEAYDYALDILSYRDYSRKDMELKLKRKGADAVIIKSTIQKLLEYGFLDEKRYGQCSTRIFLASISPFALRTRYSCSSFSERGFGKEPFPQI